MVVPFDFQEEVGIAQKARRAGDLRLLARRSAASSGVARDCGSLATRNFGSRPLPEPRRPSNCCGAWTTTIFRPTTAWARSIRSWRKRPSAPMQSSTALRVRNRRSIGCSPAQCRRMTATKSPKESAERRFHRAEGHSLLGSNAKTRWIDDWQAAAAAGRAARRGTPFAKSCVLHPALSRWLRRRSGQLLRRDQRARDADDPDQSREGAAPTIWAEGFDDGDAAVADLKACERRAGRLAADACSSQSATTTR